MSNVKKNIVASAFQVAGKLTEKLLGLLSTLILARLLVPEDFGLVAIVSLVIAFIDVLAETGAKDYIVQKESVTKDDLDTSWTFNLVLKAIVVALLFLIAPVVASYYQNESLVAAIRTLSMMAMLNALVNPQLFILQRERDYKKIFKIDIFRKVVSVIVTVCLAFYLRSYWALILGQLVSVFGKLALSYIFVPYRPSFTLINVKSQFSFSQWILLKSIFGYVRAQLDTFLVSSKFSVGALGGYHISKYIAMMPATQLLGPAMSPLLASFSDVQESEKELKHQVQFSLIILFLAVYPVTAFIFANSSGISSIILGSKWVSYSQVFGLLSVSVTTVPLINFATSILFIAKRPRDVFLFDVLTMLALFAILVGIPHHSLTSFALAKVSFDIVVTHAFLCYSMTKLKGNFDLILIVKIALTSLCFSIAFSFLVSLISLFEDLVLLNLFIKGVVYLVLWLAGYFSIYGLFLKGTEIGFHISYLAKKSLKILPFVRIFTSNS